MDPLRAAAYIGGIYALHKARDYVFICVVNYVQMFGCKLRSNLLTTISGTIIL